MPRAVHVERKRSPEGEWTRPAVTFACGHLVHFDLDAIPWDYRDEEPCPRCKELTPKDLRRMQKFQVDRIARANGCERPGNFNLDELREWVLGRVHR